MTRVLVLNPNTSEHVTSRIRDAVEACLPADASAEVRTVASGVPAIESSYGEALATIGVLEAVLAVQDSHDYDAVVIACFGDPGVEASRELLDVPVVGIGWAALRAAELLGRRYGVVSVLERDLANVEDMIDRYGAADARVGVCALPLGVGDLISAPVTSEAAVTEAARRLVVEDGAEVIILGCAGMAPYQRTLSTELGVPVINGIDVGVGFALALVRSGLKTGKTTSYARPEPKPLAGVVAGLQVGIA